VGPLPLANYSIIGLVSLTVNPLAKCQFCIFSCSRDIRVSPKISKVGHVTKATSPFGQFSFFGLVSRMVNLHAKFEVCIFSRSRDIRGSRNLKSRLRDLSNARFGQFLNF